MREIDVGANALEYLSHALQSNYAASVNSALPKIDLSKGGITTWVPDSLQSPDFSLKWFPRGLDYDDDLWMPFREGVRNYLGESKANLVFTQTIPETAIDTEDWIQKAPPGVKRFAVKCADPASVRATWEKYAGIQAPITEELVEEFMGEAFSFAQLYVFTSLPPMTS